MSVVPYSRDRTRTREDGSTYEISLTPASCYAMRDENGDYLYIGVAQNIGARISGHSNKDWFAEVKRIDLVDFEDRSDAFEFERDLIFRHSPTHNVMHKPRSISVEEAAA